MKEIILPFHLYQRIKASAGEHGGIGAAECFTRDGMPLCAHGHAWGTKARFDDSDLVEEPTLEPYLAAIENDDAVDPAANYTDEARIPFEKWCELLNVKCGPKPEVPDPDYHAFQCDPEEYELEKSA